MIQKHELSLDTTIPNFREERITDHTILTEWTLDITTVSDKYIYTFEIVNIITEDIIIEMLRDKGFIVENVTYFFVVDLRYLPDSNKLIIYFKVRCWHTFNLCLLQPFCCLQYPDRKFLLIE